MEITSLPAQWRKKADSHMHQALSLRTCAEQLELALHQASHEAEFESGCRFCKWEQENNDNYPDPG